MILFFNCRQYQLEGLNWVARLIDNGINGILADEMGLGKTLQSISVLAYMKEYLNITGPHLVMVPKSTLSNWMNEFRNWCPSIRTLKFHGNKEERQAIIDDMMRPSATQDQREWDVLITTYEIVNMERNALTKIAWRYLIIDEAHRLKNEASQFSMVRAYVTSFLLKYFLIYACDFVTLIIDCAHFKHSISIVTDRHPSSKQLTRVMGIIEFPFA